MLTLEQNIRAVLDTCFSESKDEIKEIVTSNILQLIKNAEQTEPNSSEKPNNCETCRHYTLACDLFSEICKYEPKDEPQMKDLQDWKDQMWAEAVEDEPQTDCSMISCLKCEHNEHCHYLVKDIPWPDCPWKRE